MYDLLVKQAARTKYEQYGHQPAEHDHPIALKHPGTFEQPDIEHHAKQRSEHRSQPADQRLSEAVNAQHDVEIAWLDVGVVMGVQRAA